MVPGQPAFPAQSWWLLLLVIPFYGMTTWLAFAILAARRRSPRLAAWAAVYGLVVLVGIAMSSDPALATGLLVLAWLVGSVHLALAIHQAPLAERWGYEPDLVAARRRMEKRGAAQAIAAEDPALAREAGMGRAGSGWGVLDLNHATAWEMVSELGLEAAEATRVEAVRSARGSFFSTTELTVLARLGPSGAAAVEERGILL
ncbi:MAG: hypothetical protein ACRD0J_06915 [Acidimicrobiales bacterium]